MKNSLILLAAIFCSAFAQAQTRQTVFETDSLVYFGLDFSKTKMVGFEGEKVTPEDIKESYFRSWNLVVLDEPGKFNLREAFKKKVVYKDLSVIDRKNKTVNPANIMGVRNVFYSIPRSALDTIISSYEMETTDHKTGTGFVFVIEYFSKPLREAGMYLVFFDIPTKRILMARKMSGRPQGFGLRNYWINTVYDALKGVEYYFKSWGKEKPD